VLVLISYTVLGRQPREVTPAKRQIPSLEKAIEPSVETNRSCGPGTNSDSQQGNESATVSRLAVAHPSVGLILTSQVAN